MNYNLKVRNGKVRYYMRQKNELVGSDTRLDSAEWMIEHGEVSMSSEVDGFQLEVKVGKDTYYFELDAECELAEKNELNRRKRARKISSKMSSKMSSTKDDVE